tara:strand:- start:144 stop:299 length:156 start_codon:yes stop_codon:yes gene_type:complete
MKQETKEKKETDKVKDLEKRLKDLTTHHNMVLDQISNLGLDLQMFCKKSKY